jgi:hypothetical protein
MTWWLALPLGAVLAVTAIRLDAASRMPVASLAAGRAGSGTSGGSAPPRPAETRTETQDQDRTNEGDGQ